MRQKTLFVSGSGTIIAVGDIPPELEQVGTVVRKRASNIVPLHRGKRFLFLLLRAVFGERGITAEWTRQWTGPWCAILFQTGESFIHQSRKVCLKWERERLEALYER